MDHPQGTRFSNIHGKNAHHSRVRRGGLLPSRGTRKGIGAEIAKCFSKGAASPKISALARQDALPNPPATDLPAAPTTPPDQYRDSSEKAVDDLYQPLDHK